MIKHALVQAVREMMERHWTAVEIAHKLGIDTQVVVEIIRQITT